MLVNVQRPGYEVLADDHRRQNDTKVLGNCKLSRQRAFKCCLQMEETHWWLLEVMVWIQYVPQEAPGGYCSETKILY